MDVKTKELVEIAAAVAGHCQKYFPYHYEEVLIGGIAHAVIRQSMPSLLLVPHKR